MWVNNSDSSFPVGNSALKVSDSEYCTLLKCLIFWITFISQVVCSCSTVVQWYISENISKFYVSIFLIKKKKIHTNNSPPHPTGNNKQTLLITGGGNLCWCTRKTNRQVVCHLGLDCVTAASEVYG